MSLSPTQRTLAELKRRGWTAQVVERWNPYGRVRVDLFGVIDLVAIVAGGMVSDPPSTCFQCVYKKPYGATDWRCPTCKCHWTVRKPALIGIQACAGSSHSARRAKILAEPRAQQWVDAGGKLELWSWSKRGARGKRKKWELRVETYEEMKR